MQRSGVQHGVEILKLNFVLALILVRSKPKSVTKHFKTNKKNND